MEWIKIFSSEEEAHQRVLPDKPRLLVLYGKRIVLAQHSSTFFAVQDACTHNRESLSLGTISARGEIVCPLHQYCFDLKTGRECDRRSADLETYPIKIDDSGFFVGI